MAPSVAECQRMIAACKDNGVVLAITHHQGVDQRFGQGQRVARPERHRHGDERPHRHVGRLAARWRMATRRPRFDNGGGPLLSDLGVHSLDTIIQM